MAPAPFRPFISLASALVCALIANVAQAQAQAPAPPPSWQQGRSTEQEKSALHPFAIEVTGKSAKQLPVDKLKVPDGCKVDFSCSVLRPCCHERSEEHTSELQSLTNLVCRL